MNRREALQALVALPAVKSIAVAEVKPNDVIVIESDRPLSLDSCKSIKSYASQAWPDRKILVLQDGLRMRIARETT